MLKSIATIKYLTEIDEVYAFVDKDLSLYYRTFVPKHIVLNRQKFDPHISVVRHEIVKDKTNWNKYNEMKVEFEYSNEVEHNDTYWWLVVKCEFLETLRESLGLNRLPSWHNNFHITIGNTKEA